MRTQGGKSISELVHGEFTVGSGREGEGFKNDMLNGLSGRELKRIILRNSGGSFDQFEQTRGGKTEVERRKKASISKRTLAVPENRHVIRNRTCESQGLKKGTDTRIEKSLKLQNQQKSQKTRSLTCRRKKSANSKESPRKQMVITPKQKRRRTKENAPPKKNVPVAESYPHSSGTNVPKGLI